MKVLRQAGNNFRQNQFATVVVREEVKLDAQVVMKIS